MKTAKQFLPLFFIMFVMFFFNTVQGQIWEPEGLNMPGGWNSWTNPPVNNLALASSTQVPGGRVVKIPTGIIRWQTIFSVAETGGDIVGGRYSWLFTSGPTSNPWGNKWGSVNVVMDSLQPYTKEGSDNQITVTNGKWYTMNYEDAGYNNTRAIFMMTSAQPAIISSVSVPATVNPGDAATITVSLAQNPSAEEIFFLRYTNDGWSTSSVLTFSMTGSTGTVQIPGQPADTTVSYYAFSSTKPNVSSLFDLYTIKSNNNGGANYSYTVVNPAPVITFANLNYPSVGLIYPGQTFEVIGNVEIPGITGQTIPAPGLEAWIGYSQTDTDPATWTNWVSAPYHQAWNWYDQFKGNIGTSISIPGTWYYATRYRYNSGSYVYGGYGTTTNGFWNGTTSVSGILTVMQPLVPTNRILENISIFPEEIYCYDATQTITVAGGETFFKVFPFGAVTLIAGQKIFLLPGTTVGEGGYLHGRIATNGNYCDSLSRHSEKYALSSDANPVKSINAAIRVFPNPASEFVTVQLAGLSENTSAVCELFGLQGQSILKQKLTGNGSHKIDLNHVSPGVYFLRIQSSDQIQTTKLVIN